jgi:hypothetical protein
MRMAIGPGRGGMRLRPLDIGDVLDETFRMYRQQFVPLMTVMAIVVVPASLLSLGVTLATGFSAPMIQRTIEQRGDLTTVIAGVILLILVGLVAGLLNIAAVGAAMLITSGAVLGQPIGVGEAFRQAFGRFGSLMLAGLATGIPLGLLVMTCIGIPFAFFIGLGWSVTFPTIVLEGRGAIEAMGRSWSLVRGERWRLLVCWVLIFLIYYLLVSIPSGFFAFIAGFAAVATGGNQGAMVLVQAGNVLFSAIGQVFFGSVLYITATILYYDLRVRKEAFDLEQRLPTDVPPTMPQHPSYPRYPQYPPPPPPPYNYPPPPNNYPSPPNG